MQVKGNLQLMKEINMATILNLLHREGMRTRAELTTITKLSATTVSALIEELIQLKLVEELGEKQTTGVGRRAISLQINKNGGYVVGLSFGNQYLRCAIMNLHGECIAEYKTEIGKGNERIAGQIDEALNHCMRQADGIDSSLIKGIGVSTPGIMDSSGETVLLSRYLQLKQFNVTAHIAKSYPSIPVKLVNDSNAAAFAEFYSGAAKGISNIVYLTINEGIGSGIIIHSSIYAGYQGTAGEIGHIPVDPGGEQCTCGAVGCIETVLTSPYILKKSQALASKRDVPVPASFDEVLARYNAGEEWLKPIFDKVQYVTTFMLASAGNFVSPEVIIIEGWMNESPRFMSLVKEAFEAFPFPLQFRQERIISASFGDKGSLYGAATLMLQQIFSASVLK